MPGASSLAVADPVEDLQDSSSRTVTDTKMQPITNETSRKPTRSRRVQRPAERSHVMKLRKEESVVSNEVPPSESCAGTSLPQISTESGGQEDIANYRYACRIMRFMESPRQSHLQATKRIMRYLKGTYDHGLLYSSSNNCVLIGYSDSDWGGDLDDRKNTSGYCFMLGTTACSWSSKKQSIVALSTCEAEYVATASSACQTIWLKNVMNQIHFPVQGPIKIYVDNVSAINLAKNPVTHGRSKHIDTRYHFLRDQVEKRIIELVYCKSEDQLADIFTKPLKHEAFDKFKKMIGVAVLQHQN
nr:Retrovirus-related Pol polyprotein from transposon TNT 1-94 [Ipomoea batatas]